MDVGDVQITRDFELGQRASQARIRHGDLTSLLYLQGYRRSDFIER